MIFSCGLVVNNLKGKKLPAQANKNCFHVILPRRYWNCSDMENLRWLDSAVSAVMKKCYKTEWGSLKAFFWQKMAEETHAIHLPFSCKCLTFTNIIRLELLIKLRLHPNMEIYYQIPWAKQEENGTPLFWVEVTFKCFK